MTNEPDEKRKTAYRGGGVVANAVTVIATIDVEHVRGRVGEHRRRARLKSPGGGGGGGGGNEEGSKGERLGDHGEYGGFRVRKVNEQRLAEGCWR